MSQEFDYIVVGAGSAGGLLAEKLSRNGKHTVLLLEGGGTHKRFLITMPAGWGKMLYDKNFSWGNETEPEEWAGGRRLKLPRGKALGGSSSINGLLYVRGHKLDYQDWVDAGCPGWGWEDMLPHFTQTEDQKVLKNQFHGTGGALTAGPQPYAHPTSAAMECSVNAIRLLRHSIMDLLGNVPMNRDDQVLVEVLSKMKQVHAKGDAWISFREILRYTHRKKNDIAPIMDTLVEMGRVIQNGTEYQIVL